MSLEAADTFANEDQDGFSVLANMLAPPSRAECRQCSQSMGNEERSRGHL